MVDTYLVRQLKRVHDQAAKDLEVNEPTSSEAVAERFNDLLDEFREKYPEKETLEKIESVEGVSASIGRPRSGESANRSLRKIKLQTEQIADLFELDVGDFAEVDDNPEMRPIVIENNPDFSQETNVSQKSDVSQTIEFDQIVDQVDNAMVSDTDEQELKELIQEFRDEIEEADTDESRLRDIVGRAKAIGSGVGIQVASKLTMRALKEGYNLVP